MLLPALLLLATSARADCTPRAMRHTSRWLHGTYVATPVVADRQGRAMARLGRRPFERVDLAAARAASGDSGIGPAKHYYLAKAAAYVGRWEGKLIIPPKLTMSVDVDARGTAYVTTFLLSAEREASTFAVVLVSDTPLRRVVPVCLAAE
ncbi:MAG TPA: hypothetical protein VGD56_09400 [Gemmatirosa sp.]